MCKHHILPLFILCTLLVPGLSLMAQEEDTENLDIRAGYFDTLDGGGFNYSGFKLPPLDLLFANARTTPSIELKAREEEAARALLKKQKTEFFSHLNGSASYSYGIMDNYGSNSTIASPIYYQYMGSKQHYWNVGGSLRFSLDDILDAPRKVKRQRIEVEKAALEKDIAFDELKKQIVTLYVGINNDLVSLKTAAENAASYRGAGMLTDQEFRLGDVTVRDLAETKRWESVAVQEYQSLQTRITTNILILEIITHTPIITNVVTDTGADKK